MNIEQLTQIVFENSTTIATLTAYMGMLLKLFYAVACALIVQIVFAVINSKKIRSKKA